MFLAALLLSFVLFVFGFANDEISHTRLTQDRQTVNDFSQHRQQSNGLNIDDVRFRNYNKRPIYRYDHGLNERNHPSRHHREFLGNQGHPYTTGIYRSYGRGTATIPELGATVSVSNSLSRQKVHKGTITARMMTPPIRYLGESPRVIPRHRRHCMGCPQNRAVVASRGHARVVLPEPCPTLRWMGISGPSPGMLISEGTHSLIGRLGYRGKICHYEYEVIVRHCGKFTIEFGNANCTIDDAWGSSCTITCEDGYELTGSPNLECTDDLKWSNHPPQCRKKRSCPLPQTPDNEKIWCQVPHEDSLTDDNLPADTYCRFKSEGRQRVIVCVEGYWVNKYKGKRNHRAVKRRKNKKVHKDLINSKRNLGSEQRE